MPADLHRNPALQDQFPFYFDGVHLASVGFTMRPSPLRRGAVLSGAMRYRAHPVFSSSMCFRQVTTFLPSAMSSSFPKRHFL